MEPAEAVVESLRHARFAEATLRAKELGDDEDDAEIRAVCTVLAQPYTYALGAMFDQADPTAEPSKRTLGAVKGALARIAGRVGALRTALGEALGEPAAFVPDLAALEPTADGTLKLDEANGDVLELLWLLRQEWTRLNWLLVCVGSRELALPTVVGKPPEPLDYLDTLLSARFNLLVDHADGTELTLEDDLDRGMAESRWGGPEGTPLQSLSAALAGRWLDETSAAVAAIRWLDGEHESPFDEL